MNMQPTSCPTIEAPVCTTGVPHYIFSDNFENGLVNWSTGAISQGNLWMLSNASEVDYSTFASSGSMNAFADDGYYLSDAYMAMSSDIILPAGAWMHFNHAYDFVYDGGVIEYSLDNGSNWYDVSAAALFNSGAYTGTITTAYSNPLGGRSAFVGTSRGYGSSRLNLSALSGQNFRLRFRMGTDNSPYYSYGWWIDDVMIYTCNPCADQSVAIGGTSSTFSSFLSAYTAATNGQSVLMQSSNYTENINFTKGIYTFLKGGYACDFASVPGWTTINGSLTVSNGTLNIDKIKIK
jgi:hypothetical protein